MTDNQSTHPSTMSEADKQALRESDPSAFDEDAPEGAAGSDAGAAAGGDHAGDDKAPSQGDAKPVDDAPAGDQPAGEDAGAATAPDAAAGGDAGKAPPAMVPRGRLDEVIDQRNQAEQLSMQQALELEQLRAKLAALEAPKDYEAQYEAIAKRYADGDIEEEERDRETRKLWREEQADITRRTTLATQQETLEAAMQRSWDDEVAAFNQRNPGFLQTGDNADVFQRALNSTAAFYGNTISQTELLNKAAKQAFEFTGYKPPAGADSAAPGADAGASRRAQNAARASDAAAGAPPIAGGVGERGGPSRGVDLDNLKPGTFSKKLSVEEQEKLLGGPGAV